MLDFVGNQWLVIPFFHTDIAHALLIEKLPFPHDSPARTSWWLHQMETFSALLAICTGNSPVPGEFPAQRPVTRRFDVFFDLRLNKRLSKQSWGWWFETLSRPLWRRRNAKVLCQYHVWWWDKHWVTFFIQVFVPNRRIYWWMKQLSKPKVWSFSSDHSS